MRPCMYIHIWNRGEMERKNGGFVEKENRREDFWGGGGG